MGQKYWFSKTFAEEIKEALKKLSELKNHPAEDKILNPNLKRLFSEEPFNALALQECLLEAAQASGNTDLDGCRFDDSKLKQVLNQVFDKPDSGLTKPYLKKNLRGIYTLLKDHKIKGYEKFDLDDPDNPDNPETKGSWYEEVKKGEPESHGEPKKTQADAHKEKSQSYEKPNEAQRVAESLLWVNYETQARMFRDSLLSPDNLNPVAMSSFWFFADSPTIRTWIAKRLIDNSRKFKEHATVISVPMHERMKIGEHFLNDIKQHLKIPPEKKEDSHVFDAIKEKLKTGHVIMIFDDMGLLTSEISIFMDNFIGKFYIPLHEHLLTASDHLERLNKGDRKHLVMLIGSGSNMNPSDVESRVNSHLDKLPKIKPLEKLSEISKQDVLNWQDDSHYRELFESTGFDKKWPTSLYEDSKEEPYRVLNALSKALGDFEIDDLKTYWRFLAS